MENKASIGHRVFVALLMEYVTPDDGLQRTKWQHCTEFLSESCAQSNFPELISICQFCAEKVHRPFPSYETPLVFLFLSKLLFSVMHHLPFYERGCLRKDVAAGVALSKRGTYTAPVIRWNCVPGKRAPQLAF